MLTHADGRQGWLDHNRRCSRFEAGRGDGVRRGFTLVELTITLGMVMILLGLLAPAVGRSMDSARTTRNAAQLRQCMALVTQYAGDRRDVYPIAHENAFTAGWWWYRELQSAGYIRSPMEVDPVAYGKFGNVTFALSVCLVYSPEYMQPGRTRWPDRAMSAAVRQASVPYPSAKGAMLQKYSGEGTVNEGANWFCCGQPWRAPVAMCDGAVVITDYLELNGGRQPLIVDQIGAPVWATWGGYLARDR